MKYIIADTTGSDFLIGETFVDGQKRDVWCYSKIPIVDMKMHNNGRPERSQIDTFVKPASCYNVCYNSVAAVLILYGDSCLMSSNPPLGFHFLCE
jgi:hypothetical protein